MTASNNRAGRHLLDPESAALLRLNGSSFYRLLQTCAPQALPEISVPIAPDEAQLPHGTTVVAMHYRDGVVMAADRRATMGNLIAQRDLRKLEPADSHSGIAFAGTVGTAMRLVSLFQLELLHYEKIEGVALSFPAKVNRVSTLIRGNLGPARQGLAVIPLFAGWDDHAGAARVFTFDIGGSASEQREYGGAGSGSTFALGSLKKLYRPELTRSEAIRIVLTALTDAADEDTATGGPQAPGHLLPLVSCIDESGYAAVPTEEIAAELVAAD
ncbi:proteasome subunit beta [Actinoalloteichus hymeniacidonis]|uniref:proteasome subunit beta n=1 Tax=Actinoalloteichus hymeniacidonis TaxID=340345 RepID=UPI0015612B10|nr:proteasome subunit beta [Actinoalloteichus hymeniacidonis]MBB5908065.1 proteasome beta subunit [Actinoalloteichus hymeniacidonis]